MGCGLGWHSGGRDTGHLGCAQNGDLIYCPGQAGEDIVHRIAQKPMTGTWLARPCLNPLLAGDKTPLVKALTGFLCLEWGSGTGVGLEWSNLEAWPACDQ